MPADRSTVSHESRTPPAQRFFASCPRGLETPLAAELSVLGADQIVPTDGGVSFSGDLRLCYRANLESRIASRILIRLGTWDYRSEDDIYQAVATLSWRGLFDVGRTIRVGVAAVGSPLKSLDYITLRIKDAVCDSFREDTGQRPSVDTANPDIRIHAFFEANRFTLYLDSSGEALFKRGYRRSRSEAPVRENLAAGILALSGWRPGVPLLDPMCGSGTFLVEAALIALRIPPGIARTFAFQKLRSFDAELWNGVRSTAQTECLSPHPLALYGADRYGAQLDLARRNLDAAGVQAAVTLKQADVLELRPPSEPGVMITNPPYGVRLGEQEELARLYPRLGDALKHKYAGWRVWIFSGDQRLPKLIGLKPSRRIPLFNGALECRLYGFEIVAGSMRRRSEAAEVRGRR
ncbi:MAG TPA: THUMP domain-containing protein [Burkholderiales bacterium]|nr:THUMP domain-containing protein [Burkholderiales bacterium]